MTLSGNWKLDPTHSEAGFTARHAGISKVRGRFSDVDATVDYHDDGTADVTATLQADSFTTGNADRDGHVKSADFLDVANFPTLTFAGKYGGSELSGDITIHGVTKPITFEVESSEEVTDPFGNVRVGVEAQATISRKDFGLTWNAALETGGVLVSDRIKLNLDLSFIKTV